MADNKQNSETGNTQATGNKSTTASGGAASPKQAKTEDAASKSASQSGSSSAQDTLDKAKAAAGTIADQAKDKAASIVDEQKSNLASGINSVADSIRHIGGNLGGDDKSPVAVIAGKYSDNIAGQVEKFSSYIDDHELKELVSDVEKFARRNPALFVGSAFVLGILAARFLKSSGQSSRKRS